MAQFTSKPGLEAERSLMARWQVLTQRRLDYLIELQNSGRWQRYHTLDELVEMVREAREALQAWQKLAVPIGMALPAGDGAGDRQLLLNDSPLGEMRAAAG